MRKSRSIKKTLPRLAFLMTLLFLLLVLPMNIFVQLIMYHNSQLENTKETFGQLEQVIQKNRKNLEHEKQLFKERCIRSAEMVAYYVEHNRESVWDIKEATELAEVLEVDEIHYFTPKGEIFAGTHPEYYGYTFDSGKQMHFFSPMLKDKSLKLCQDITPNTAEGKEMQYAAVWMKDGSGIVQIGMEPRHLQKKMKENSLQNIIGELPFEKNSYLHIIDKNAKKVIASTAESWPGKKIEWEPKKQSEKHIVNIFHHRFEGTRYCVYTKSYDRYIMVRSYNSSYLMSSIAKSSGLVLIYILMGTLGIIAVMRWYIRCSLVENLNGIIHELTKIEKGDMENIDMKTNVTEFDELLFYINQMLNNIRLNWSKLTYIMDKGEMSIGIFEINTFYKRTFVNERLISILGVKVQSDVSSEQTADLILEKLVRAEKNEVDSVEHICVYDRNGSTRYLRIEKITDKQSLVYYVTDMTLWWEEINEIKEQSIMDELTGLYNRRGFYKQMNQLFEESKLTGSAAVIMIDADNLKKINDYSGHHTGDRYLKNIADLLCKTAGDSSVCARLGGDEFVVLLYGSSGIEDLEKRIAHMKEERGQPFTTDQEDTQYTLEFSMGTAVYPMEGRDFHKLMQIADENMYREKKARKNLK